MKKERNSYLSDLWAVFDEKITIFERIFEGYMMVIIL